MFRNFIFRISFFTFALFLTGCGNKVLLDEEHTFSNNTWSRFSPETFDVAIGNADKYYHIDYTVTFDTGLYRYDKLPLVVDIHGEDGTHRHMGPTITLRENGRWKGEMEGPYRTVKARVYNFFTFNQPGTYSYQVKQGTSQYDLEGIHAIRITMEEARLEYERL